MKARLFGSAILAVCAFRNRSLKRQVSPEEVELQVRGNTVVISSRRTARAGWAEAARRMREAGHDRLLDKTTATRFDEEAWRWR